MVAKISPNLREIRAFAKAMKDRRSVTLYRQLEEFVVMLEEVAEGKDMSEILNTPGFASNTVLENYVGDRYIRVKDLLGMT